MHEDSFPFYPAAVTGPSIALFRCPCAIYYWNCAEPGNKIPFLFPTVFFIGPHAATAPSSECAAAAFVVSPKWGLLYGHMSLRLRRPFQRSGALLGEHWGDRSTQPPCASRKEILHSARFSDQSLPTVQVTLCEPNWKFLTFLEAKRFQLIPDV